MTLHEDGHPVPMADWGKDHWSVLAYVETCAVEQQTLDRRRLRINPKRHPLLAHISWDNRDYPTMLGRGATLGNHDDWDCIEDLEEAGLVNILSAVNTAVTMTELGTEIAHALRRHKLAGHNFAEFSWNPSKSS